MNRRKTWMSLIAASAVFVSAVGVQPAMAQETPYYEGKRITLLLPFAAGGATDLRARALAPFLQRHIPGNPQILVENMPGAGGAVGMNYFETRVNPDGLTLVVPSAAVPLRWLAKATGHDYDLAAMRLVAGFPGSMVLYGRTDTASDLEALLARQDLRSAHTTEFSLLAAETDVMASYLGFPLRRVYGYAASGDMMLAVLRGDTQLSAATAVSFASEVQPNVDNGDLVPLFQFGYLAGDGIVADSRVPDIPLVWDFYRERTGLNPEDHENWTLAQTLATLRAAGQTVFLPAGTSDEIYDIIVQAMEDIVASEDYQDTIRRISGVEDVILVGAEAQEAFDRLTLIPLEIAVQLQD